MAAAPSIHSSLAGTVTLSVRIGRVLAAAALFIAPALITPAHGAGLSIADPSGACASWSWNAGTSTLTCVAAQAPAPGAPVCTLTANGTNPLTVASATLVALAANCTNVDPNNTTYSWTGSGAQATTSVSSQSVTVSATTQFGVIARNNTTGLSSNSRTVMVTVGGGGGAGGGGGGGNIPTCDGFSSTIKMNFNYVPGTGQVVQTSQGMGTTDILVASFTTPATIAGGTGSGGTLQITDNAMGSNGFVASLSTTPCTFTSNVKSGLLSASWSFSTYHLQPSTTYYVNIKGDSPLSVKLLAR